jgi:hypothetical protein
LILLKLIGRIRHFTLGDKTGVNSNGLRLWEQAYENDELLKPFKNTLLNVESVSIMGKAGILEGGKGDIMIPNAHINEGTADNYFFENELTAEMFEGNDIAVLRTNGHRVRNLASNRDLLKFFHESTWE